MVPPAFTAQARQLLGADKLLVVGLAIAVKVREQLAAGADHVIIIANGADFADGIDQLVGLASTLVA